MDTKDTITARIERDEHGTGCWLIIEHADEPLHNTKMEAIMESEIPAIMNACGVWLEQKEKELE